MVLLKRSIVVALLLSLASCNGKAPPPPIVTPPQVNLKRYEYTQLHMGVPTRLVVYAANETLAAIACQNAFERIAQLEDVMSDYRPSSELMQLVGKAGGPAVPLSLDLFIVLQRAQELAEQSGGAFDVTVGPYVRLWRDARARHRLPARRDLEEASQRVGWQKLRIDTRRRTARLMVPRMQLDLGGIGKGYAGDAAIAVLREHGITSALFESGGDIVVSDAPPDAEGWMVQIINPNNPKQMQTIPVSNAAVSTSGDTEQFVEIEGVRYSHIVDPRTGLGVTHRTMCTIIAPDGLTSDSLATAGCILGAREGARLLRRYPEAQGIWRTVE
jgi:FAD:protein FMN transferase